LLLYLVTFVNIALDTKIKLLKKNLCKDDSTIHQDMYLSEINTMKYLPKHVCED